MYDRELKLINKFCKIHKQESPADAGIPARRKNEKIPPLRTVITSSSQVGNPVFMVIKFLIQITSTYNNSTV